MVNLTYRNFIYWDAMYEYAIEKVDYTVWYDVADRIVTLTDLNICRKLVETFDINVGWYGGGTV